jgi:hypothetical protein
VLTTPELRSFSLAPHVHVCSTGRHVVLLDLKRNEYVGLNVGDARGLQQVVSGWPSEGSERLSRDSPSLDAELLGELLETGMVRQGSAAARPVSAASYPSPRVALTDGYVKVRASITKLDVLRFLKAALVAKLELRLRSMDRVVGRVARRRERALIFAAHGGAISASHARQLVAKYKRLRTFLFTSHNECLYDSLALSEFLACYGLFPHWLFGVTTNPFSAHCWLQAQDLVLNDTPHNLRRFTPIMIA